MRANRLAAGRLHCVFPCGSYQEDGHIHMVYGGADAYTLAARVDTDLLLARLS